MVAAAAAIQLVSSDTRESYLANAERQDAIERRLIRFGEALKDTPAEILNEVEPNLSWSEPIKFRDLSAHWYEGALSHEVVWAVLKEDLPKRVASIERYLAAQEDADERP